MSKKSTIITNWPKHLLQWGTLALIIAIIVFLKSDPEKYCPMGGLEAFVTYITRGSLPCSMSSLQIMMGLALAAAVILFSKLFCAFLCPVGTVEDLLIRLRKALKIKGCEIRKGSVADKLLRIVKYALLFWIFYSTATASELFCKNLDPYYAVATGFKGEITLWMSVTTVVLVVLGGLFVKRFWCKYICPLGAASNTLKFWMWLLLLGIAWWILTLFGVNVQWPALLLAFCIIGYLLEIFHGNPRAQILHVVVNEKACGKTCHSCQKACPYNIDAPACGSMISDVDCTLCGECVAACPSKALHIGVSPKKEKTCAFSKFIPAIIAVVLTIAAIIAGKSFELPTIDVTWDTENISNLETVRIEHLTSVKCYGSSMAFKARMEKVRGVHGVKTYVGSHTVVITYDPSVTTAKKVQEEVFIPSRFRISNPDPAKIPELKVMTIRTEKMYDKLNLNFLGIQMSLTGRKIYGLDSEYDCPLIVHVYMDPEENPDEQWFREVVNKKSLDLPVANGSIKSTPLDFEFVRLEKGSTTINTAEYRQKMFEGFSAEFNGRYTEADSTYIQKRAEHYADQPQFIYEVPGEVYEKPIVRRSFPFLSNHLSKEEGVIGMYLNLDKNYTPAIQIRFAAPMTADRIWELMSMETWTITYSEDDVREEPARIKFDNPGICYEYVKE